MHTIGSFNERMRGGGCSPTNCVQYLVLITRIFHTLTQLFRKLRQYFLDPRLFSGTTFIMRSQQRSKSEQTIPTFFNNLEMVESSIRPTILQDCEWYYFWSEMWRNTNWNRVLPREISTANMSRHISLDSIIQDLQSDKITRRKVSMHANNIS